MGSLAVRWLGPRYRYIMPDHVNYFTATTLRRFVASEPRFQVVRSGQSHFNPLVIVKDWRGRGARVAEADRARLLKRTTGFKQSRWLTPVRWAYAAAEGALKTLGLADNLVLVLRRTDEAA